MSNEISNCNHYENYIILLNRRDFMKLTTYSGVAFSTGLVGINTFSNSGRQDEFYFVQLSDTHCGFNNKKFNADPERTFPKAVELVNQLDPKPDFMEKKHEIISYHKKLLRMMHNH